MVEWLSENLAALSAILVPITVSIVGPLMQREKLSRDLRRMRQHAELRRLLPKKSKAANNLDATLAVETHQLLLRVEERSNRSLDGTNLAVMIATSLVGGVISYFLVLWAQSLSGIWQVLVWMLLVSWVMLILLFVLVGGLPSLYKQKTPGVKENSSELADS